LPTIKFEEVSKRFGKSVVALDRVSFDVHDGEYLCVLGPTGSGKTTLLRLIAGLLRADEGTIYFNGKSVNNIDPHDRNAVYVPQQYALFPHMTVLENVAFGPLSHQVPEADALNAARETLEIVHLAWREQAYPSELSGGMQQRVALARGLASGARLLLLDEPLGALDARLRLELRHKLRDIVKSSGFTAIHVTHDRDEALSVADRMLVLRGGRIQDHGPPSQIYANPRGIFVANLVGGANFLEGIVESLTEEGSTVRLRGGIIIKCRATQFRLDQPTVLALRKERVELFDHDREHDNRLEGEVRAIHFLGDSREYLVRLDNGDVLASRRFGEDFTPAFSVGEKVFIGFEKRDPMVFPYPSQGLRKELEVT
jgi:ABC-type Fe3+/spermidine/putrescine transport system ATPase subunit